MVLSKWFPSSPFVFHLKVNTTFKCSLTHNLCFQPYYFLVNVVCMGVISPYVSSIILLAHTILHEIIVQFENSIYSVCMCICMRNIMSQEKENQEYLHCTKRLASQYKTNDKGEYCSHTQLRTERNGEKHIENLLSSSIPICLQSK